MKEDYLWDKTGSDPEIEELENSLKEFRSTNAIAPKLPQKTFVFDKDSLQNESSRRFSFRFAFAAFACLAFAIVSVGLFQVFNTGEQDLARNTSQETSEEPKTEKRTVIESTPIVKEIIKKETTQQEVVKTRFTPKPKVQMKPQVTAKKQVRTNIKNNTIIAKQVKRTTVDTETKVKTVTLTKEEKEAYETLMQALSITGSQMRIVQEGINGVEEKPVVKKKGR